ncbi:MAG: efflux RND transporter permease subunit, partial [Planctomycetota bacterium]
DLRYARLVSARYGREELVVLTYTPRGELFAEDTLARLARLRDELGGLDRVLSVRTILDVPLLQSPPVSLKALKDGLPTLESPGADRVAAPAELRNSPLYRNLLLSPDGRTTALLVSFRGDDVHDELLRRRDELRNQGAAGPLSGAQRAELARVVERLREHADVIARRRHEDIAAIRAVMDRHRGDADLFLGGTRMIADDMITFIRNDLKVFGLGGAAALVLMLGVIFRRIRWVCLPMVCCAASAVSVIGLLGWLGWQVTVISANFISLQLIITMAIAVHLVVRYRELLGRDPLAPNRRLILDTVRLKLKPCVYAVLTTMVGFGSLLLCDILPVIMLGWMMMVGLAVSLIATFLLFPAVLVLLPKEKPPPARRHHAYLTSALARLTEAARLPILAVSGLVLIGSLVGISRLRVENCFIDYFHPNTEIHRGMKVIDEHLGGTTPLDVIVEFDEPDAPDPATSAGDDDEFDEFDELDEAATDEKYWFTAEKMSRLRAAHDYLDGLPETGKVLSLATAMDIAEQLNGGKALDSFELALLYGKTPDEFRDMLVEPYASVPHNQARLSVRVKDSGKALRRDELLKKIEKDLPGVLGVGADKVHLAGLLVLYNNMLQSLFGSQILTLGITVALLSGMFLVLFGSWRVAAIAMVPNVLPVAVVLGVIGVGIAVDDTIHYMHRFKAELRQGTRYLPAMHRCHGSIGRAMYYTTVTITIGLAILSLSNFIPTVSFGLLTGLAMIVALLADLTVLPAMLVLAKPFGKEA